MHSQAKLIQHLNAAKALIVKRHEQGDGRELCICLSSNQAAGLDDYSPLHLTVKQLVTAEFVKQGKDSSPNMYMYPVRVGTYPSQCNFYGTAEEVEAGYHARLALIDRWIADANKKLVAAVFRKATDLLGADEHYFMCNAIKEAACLLEDGRDWFSYKSAVTSHALEVLEMFKPRGVDMSDGWYDGYHGGAHIKALRIAILNLCITQVTRGFQ